jgi:hypothetical protein
MGQLVDEGHPGPSSQHRVEVHLLNPRAPVVNRFARYDLKAGDQFLDLGGGACVRLRGVAHVLQPRVPVRHAPLAAAVSSG